MSEDNRSSSGPSSEKSIGEGITTSQSSTSSSRYDQAIRFLISLKSQEKQDRDAQKQFLLSKGLTEQEIETAFEEIKKPQTIAKDGLVNVDQTTKESLNDEEAFDLAAKAFDDPLQSSSNNSLIPTTTTQDYSTANSPSLPARTYPKSPLALYQQSQPQGMHDINGNSSSIDNPLTRYHVVLRFLRSLCYFLVLGGGMTSIAVAIYRAYLMPRLIETLDARSNLLQHHRNLYTILANKVQNLKKNSLAPPTSASSNQAQQSSTLKGVLKKVQFADEVQEKVVVEEDGKVVGEEEEKKESGEKELASVVEKEKQPLLESKGEEETKKEGEEKVEEKQEKPVIVPIDILEPLRADLSRLSQALQADTSGFAIGTEIGSVKAEQGLATTVEEEGEEGWISDEDSDELEFDPFATPLTNNSKKASKRKHSPKTSAFSNPSSRQSTTDSSSNAATTLRSTMNSMNAYINTQTYMANANVFGAKSFGFSSIGSGSVGNSDQSSSSKSGEVAQIRAEIRSLKGLLLSRRNFPIYNRPTQPQTTRVEPTA